MIFCCSRDTPISLSKLVFHYECVTKIPRMESKIEKLVRFNNNGSTDMGKPLPAYKATVPLLNTEGGHSHGIGSTSSNIRIPKFGKFKVFPEDHEPLRERILDPGSENYLQWNRIFLFWCLVALFVDPLFFYLPSVIDKAATSCMETDLSSSQFQVPFFSQMDDQLLDAICERLVSSLSTQGTYIVRKGDPVTEMLFIIRGKLESCTTNGGRTGFFNSINLRPGDFCGEELLSWALLPNSSSNLPSSTRTVRALVEVEAFVLRAEDLKFVANQFRRLHSKTLQHTFRYYSYHWRSWGACFIQAAWHRHTKRMMARNLITSSKTSQVKQNLGVTILASKFAANTRRGAQKMKEIELLKLQKPLDPEFSDEPDYE